MISKSRIPMLHAVALTVAAFLYLIYMYLSGRVTAAPGEALWHYIVGGMGVWALYTAIHFLSQRRNIAYGAALIWAVSPATMGLNATSGVEGPLIALAAIGVYGFVRLYQSNRIRGAILIILALLSGAALNIITVLLTSPECTSGGIKEVIVDLLYTRSAIRPGGNQGVLGAYLSVPWLIIAWVYLLSIVHIIVHWQRHNRRTAILTSICAFGLVGGPGASLTGAFVLAAIMLSGTENTHFAFFAQRKALHVCMAIIVVWSILLIITEGPVWFGDSQSYYSAANRLVGGSIDYYRTPLYPLLLIAVNVFGSGSEWVVIILQFIGLWVSALLLYQMIRLIWSSPSGAQAAFWVTLLYGIGAPTASMCTLISTEPLATAFVVVCAYSMTLLWKSGFTLSRLLWLTISLLIMVALRPAMMYMIVVVGVLGIAALISRRRAVALGSLGTVVVTVITVLSYCAAMQRQTGIFSPSLVGAVNRYADIAYANPPLDSVSTRQRAVLADVKANGVDPNGHMLVWAAPMFIERHGTQPFNEFMEDVEATHYNHIRAAKFNRLAAQYDSRPMMVCNSLMTYMSASLLTVPFSIVVLLMVVWPCIAMTRGRSMRIMPTLLYLCAAGNLLAVLIGAPDATARLLAPSSSVLLFLGADLLLMIKRKH